MKSIRSLEGELYIDHRNSPGLPDEIARAAGLPLGAGRGIYEGPIYTCGHCQRGVTVVVTAFGGREHRHLCKACNHVICDTCAEEKRRTGVCVPFEAKVAAILEEAEKG